MGEPPIFSTSAYVFQIDRDTKKKWVPVSSKAVLVSFYYDSARRIYRIICVEMTKILINCTVTATMQFTRCSQKFGQWLDEKSNTVYAVAFALDNDLVKFIEKFEEVKKLSRDVSSSSSPFSLPATSPRHPPSPPPRSSISPSSPLHTSGRSASASPLTRTSIQSEPALPLTLVEQLQKENERLKTALAKSALKVGKQNSELAILRANNERLSESARQIESESGLLQQRLKECATEKAKLLEQLSLLENEPLGNAKQPRAQLIAIYKRIDAIESSGTDQELRWCKRQTDDISGARAQNSELTSKIAQAEDEAAKWRREIAQSQRLLEQLRHSVAGNQSELSDIQKEISAKLQDLKRMNARRTVLMNVRMDN